MPSLWWVIETTDNKKFPYLLSIKNDDNTLLRLLTQLKLLPAPRALPAGKRETPFYYLLPAENRAVFFANVFWK